MQTVPRVGTAPGPPQPRLAVYAALRHPSYRYYWFGTAASILGLQIVMLAQAWLVYDMTQSPALLGLVTFAQAVPAILLNPLGGVAADRMDRRKLLLATQAASALLMLVLGVLTSTGLIQVWHLVGVALAAGALGAFDQPARMALVPQLVEREDLMNAVALQSMVWQGSRIIGPGIAGVVIATAGVGACFYITAALVGVMVAAMARMKVLHPAPKTQDRHVGRNLAEGVRFIFNNPIFSTLIGMTFFNSLFGMSYVILLPVFARDVFGAGSTGYAVLAGVPGIGALCGNLVVASLGDFRHKGWLALGGAACFGLLLVLFALSSSLVLSAGILFVAGFVNSVYMTTVNTSLQSLVPDQLRGRVMGLYSLTWGLLPVGGMIGGGVAQLTSAPVAVAAGGALVAAMAVFAAIRLPQVRTI